VHIKPHDHAAFRSIPSTGIAVELLSSFVDIHHLENGELVDIIHQHHRIERESSLEIQLGLCGECDSHIRFFEGIPRHKVFRMNIILASVRKGVSQD
jgi:hypothetical protein